MRMIASIAAAVIALAMIPLTAHAQNRAISLDELRQHFIARFEQAAPEADLTPTADGLIVTLEDGSEFRLFLDRAMSRVTAGERVEDVVNGMVASTLAPGPGAFDPARAFILIRPAEFVAFAEAQGPEGIELVSRPFAGDLVMVLAEDLVDRFSYPPAETVSETRPDLDAAWRDALSRTHAEQGEAVLEAVDSGVWILSARWDIAASLVLDDAVWTRADVAALGEVAVGILKDALVLVETDQPASVGHIRGFLADMRSDPNYQSDLLFVRRDGEWQVYD